jgi:hypothetical protein
MVFENRVLGRLFGPERDGVTREWRKLHNKELSDPQSLPIVVRMIKSRRMRWVRYVARTRKRRGVYRFMMGNPDGKRLLGISRHRWEENIKMDLQEVGCEGVDWIELAHDRERQRVLVNVVKNIWVP